MSLLDKASQLTSPYKMMLSERASENDQPKFIIQPNILMDILNDEMEKRCIDKKSKKQFAGYRTRIKKTEWRLSGMLNYVNEELYREQIGKTLESMVKHIKLVQPNGDWVVMEFESDIRPNAANDDAIMLAVNFVDVRNEKDLRYQNGIPVVDVNVDMTGSNQELIDVIKAQGENSNDDELKDLMKQFIGMMAKKEMDAQNVQSKSAKVEEKFEEEPEGFVE